MDKTEIKIAAELMEVKLCESCGDIATAEWLCPKRTPTGIKEELVFTCRHCYSEGLLF